MDNYDYCDVCNSICGGMGGRKVPEGAPLICPALVKPNSSDTSKIDFTSTEDDTKPEEY
tara:strand:- start:382 stop:558 length:177 start_codon:yes stop_codon:yes gene_type:complete